MNTGPCEPDMTWLVDALTQGFAIRTDIPFEAWLETGEQVRCQACISREIHRVLSSPQSELAPSMVEFFVRYIESRLVAVE